MDIIRQQAIEAVYQFPTAKDARQETDSIRISANSEVIKEIMASISEAIGKGEYSIYYYGVLPKDVIEAFRGKGYKVEYSSHMNESQTKISWEEA